ncbi:MAG: hypothetical protein WCL18_07725 [bacterium]
MLAAKNITTLATQTAIDQTVINTMNLSLAQCKETAFTKEELNGSVRKAITSNEDV